MLFFVIMTFVCTLLRSETLVLRGKIRVHITYISAEFMKQASYTKTIYKHSRSNAESTSAFITWCIHSMSNKYLNLHTPYFLNHYTQSMPQTMVGSTYF